MKIYNVLVTGTSSYGVGEGILKVINSSIYRKRIRLIGASNSNLTAYKHIVDNYYILPSANDKEYINKLRELLQTEKIDILIPGSEAEMIVLSNSIDIVGQITDIWINPKSIINIFNNKLKTNMFLIDKKFKTPLVYNNSDIKNRDGLKYPVILKPIEGKSSENIYIVNNLTQFNAVTSFYKSYNIDFITQEYIEKDTEYTVSIINLGLDQQHIFIMKRVLNKGATQFALVEENHKIKEIVLELHNNIKKELILNIQIIKKGDSFYIIEVNPRFSGSAPMRAKLGFNEFDIIFSKKYLNQNLSTNINTGNYVIRGFNEFIY